MPDKRRPRLTDIQAYRRLFRYLAGKRGLIVVLILAMVSEAVFTVGTVSLIKPMMDLLFKGWLIDPALTREEAAFEVGRVTPLPGDGWGAAAAGRLDGRAAGRAEDTIASLIERSPDHVLLDLRSVDAIGPQGWSRLAAAAVTVEARTSPTVTVVIPAGTTVPKGFPSATTAFRLVAAATSAESALKSDLDVLSPPTATAKADGTGKKMRVVAAKVAMPYIQAVERFSQGNLLTVIGVLLSVLFVCACGVAISGFVVGYISSYLGRLVVFRLTNHLFSHMMGLDLAFFHRHPTGGLMSVITQDVAMTAQAVDVLFSSVLKTPITVVFLVGMMFAVSAKMTFFCMFVAPAMAILVFVVGKRVRAVSLNVQRSRADLSKMVEEAFTGVRVVKGFNMEDYERERFTAESRQVLDLNMKTTFADEFGTGFVKLLGFVTAGAVVAAGGYTVLQTHELSASDFAWFIGLLSQLFNPLRSVSKTNSRIQQGLAGCDRVFRVLDSVPAISDKADAVDAAPLRNEICFENVVFSYENSSEPTLKGIDLIVPRGRAVAIVGETGAGKSTVVNLLPRFFDPTGGRVTWDGIDLRDLKVYSLRQQIGLITQEVILFDDTVANNIAYGVESGVSRERIEEAARAANAHKFIVEKLPQGYETRIGSRGVRLSGGERQRLAIARAILKNAPVLVLDEATSALDSETEALIQDALAKLVEGRTVFVIAHRLSTIMSCDEIIVIDGGRIVERGTHTQLMGLAGGRYARSYSIQYGLKPDPESP